MIHRIRIQNYKSIRDVTVELSPVTVLIGRSGTGKTNFCEAIRLLRDLLIGGQPDIPGRLTAAKPMTHPGVDVSFEVDFSVSGYDETFRYELVTNHTQRPIHESLRVGDGLVFSHSDARPKHSQPEAKWDVPPALAIVPPAGPLALTRLPGIEFATVALSSLTGGIGIYSFPHNVLEKSNPGESGLLDDASNALGAIRALWFNPQCRRDRASLVASLKQINSRVLSVDLDSVQSPKHAFIGHDFGDTILPMPLSSESSGFRRFLAHLLALYQTPPKQTLIFEEPENGIFPGALSILAEEFHATPEAGRGQVIFTTHNPIFLDKFAPDQIRVVEMDESLETQIGPLAADQVEAICQKLMDPGDLFRLDRPRREVVAQ